MRIASRRRLAVAAAGALIVGALAWSGGAAAWSGGAADRDAVVQPSKVEVPNLKVTAVEDAERGHMPGLSFPPGPR